jgi:general secretion pathway protein F
MQFELKAVRAPESIVALSLEAVDESDARAQAGAQGYTVLSARAKLSLHAWLAPRRSRFPLMLFSQQLLALMNAGLTVVNAVATLAEKEARP